MRLWWLTYREGCPPAGVVIIELPSLIQARLLAAARAALIARRRLVKAMRSTPRRPRACLKLWSRRCYNRRKPRNCFGSTRASLDLISFIFRSLMQACGRALTKLGLSLICGARCTFNEDEQKTIAGAIMDHLESTNWKIERGPPRDAHGRTRTMPR